MPRSPVPSYVLSGKDSFLAKYKIKDQEFEDAGLNWNDLETIFKDYSSWHRNLLDEAENIAANLRKCPAVHAVRSRVKNPEKLIEKIIRRSIEDGSPWASSRNYIEKAPDLIGVRAIYLFHEQWFSVDRYLRDNFSIRRRPAPTAYIQKPIPKRIRRAFDAAGLVIEKGKDGYQSVHYETYRKIVSKIIRIELQARTLHQEAWGEISHVTAYPYRKKVTLLVKSMGKLAGLTARADHFSTVIHYLTQLWDARVTGRDPSPELVNAYTESVQFLQTYYPEIVGELSKATSEFSIPKLDLSFEIPHV